MSPKTCGDFRGHLTCKMLPLLRTSPHDCDCGGCCDTSLEAYTRLPPVLSTSLVTHEAPPSRPAVVGPLLLALLGVALVVAVKVRQRARQERPLML